MGASCGCHAITVESGEGNVSRWNESVERGVLGEDSTRRSVRGWKSECKGGRVNFFVMFPSGSEVGITSGRTLELDLSFFALN